MKKRDYILSGAILVGIVIIGAVLVGLIINDDGKDRCDYNSDTKNYIGKSVNECSRLQILCVEGYRNFKDSCGCGCEKVEEVNNTMMEKNYCTQKSREAGACIQFYKPVCGWFDSSKIQCVRYPCAQAFSNSCFACMDENVDYWTDGECPK